ncbi:MAG: hypothetical protein ACREO5_00085, partial [Candidatus Binatia bacterium]
MPVSDSVFERLNTAQPYKSQDEIASDKVGAEKEAGLERSDEQTSFLTAMKEHFKAGVAGSAELANTGARLFMASVDPSLYMEMPATLSETLAGTKKTGYEKFPSFLQPGAARKALGVDDEAIKKEGPVARAFGGAAEGVGSVLSLPGVGPAKVAGETVVAGVKAAASAIGKNVTLGMGMGEVSEIGKYVFGGMGEWIDKHILGGEGTTGRAVGEEGGAIVGGGVGGYANNVRFNAMGAAASKGGKIVGKSVTSIGPAIADTIKAKRAGDERASFDIFMDHYSELKAQGLGYLQARTNEQIAAIIARDPQHQQELYDFHEATKQADVDANLFSTGQKAANPVLTQMESTQRRTKEEAATAAAGKSAQKGAIVTAYHKIVDKPLPTTVPAMKESLELFRTGTEAQAANMLLQKKELAQIIPNWSANEAAVSGKRFRDEWDIERAAAKAETKKSYDNVYAAADADGSRYDLAPVLKDTKEVLGPLLARVDTGTVPNS